jgi:XTP/dITP diphosphohydrolase
MPALLILTPKTHLRKLTVNSSNAFNTLKVRRKENGKQLHDMSLTEMDIFWDEAKKL